MRAIVQPKRVGHPIKLPESKTQRCVPGPARDAGTSLGLRTALAPSPSRSHRVNDEEFEEVPVDAVATGAAHDFSQIPIYSITSGRSPPKRRVDAQGDIYEAEADRIADRVMRMPVPRVSRGEEGPMQPMTSDRPAYLRMRRGESNPATAAAVPPIVQEVLRSPGAELDADTRHFMEPRFACDLSAVRVHTGDKAAESARAISAAAYTVGRNIVFAGGNSAGRNALTAHELTHVVQQGGVRPGVGTHQLGLSRLSGGLVQLAPAGVTFSLDIDAFEGKVRRAIAYLANVQSSAEETTFVFYTVPILSQIAVGGFSYIERNGTRHPGAVLGFTFPSGRFSLSLVLDDTPPPASGDVERGYFQASGNTGKIGLRLQSNLAQQSDQEVADVLYHETIHLYSHLLRSGLWFSSSQTGRTVLPAVRGALDLTSYGAEIGHVQRRINSFIPLVNQARQSRGATAITAAQISEFAERLVEEAVVRAETDYFTSVRRTGPGARAAEHEIRITGGGSFLNEYLFQFEDMLTPADATAISGNHGAQYALQIIQTILDAVYHQHFRLRWGPLPRTQGLPAVRPSLARGFRP